MTSVNDQPVADAQGVATPEDTAKLITLTGSDVDNNPLTFSIVNPPTNGVLSGLNPTTGLVTYTPGTNYRGADSFTFRVNDGTTNSASASVSITVTPLQLEFTDAVGTPVSAYQIGDNIFVTMSDADANTSPSSVQTLSVTVTNTSHSDRETITLTETGPNTGVFRNSAPLPLSASAGLSPQDGTLNGAAGDTLAVGYTDPLSGGRYRGGRGRPGQPAAAAREHAGPRRPR